MNHERVQKAIAVMERVKARNSSFDMSKWQDIPDDGKTPASLSEEELHACGTPACFGGWLSLSQEWKDEGGFVSLGSAQPIFEKLRGTWAIAAWLGVSFKQASALTHPIEFREANGLKEAEIITVDHVIAALEGLQE